MDETGSSFTDPTHMPLGDVVDRSGEIRLGRIVRRPPRISASAVVASIVGLIVAYLVANLAQVVQTGSSHGADPVDAIVVLGAAQYDGRPSPQLAARLDHVVTLWNDGVAPLVVVTGGNRPGDRFTEAEASAEYLAERGIPVAAMLLERQGSTTYESLAGAAALLRERDLMHVALVTDPYHALRSRLTAEEVGLSVDVAATPTSVVKGGAAIRRDLEEAAGVAVGRIVGFGRLSGWTG